MKILSVFVLVMVLGMSLFTFAQSSPSIVEDNTAFSFDVYQQIRQTEDGNIIFSPYSISQALAMTYGGANGTTATEMASAMHFSLAPAELNPAFADLNSALLPPPSSENDAFQLSIANALWGQAGFGFNPAYLESVNQYYSGGFQEMNFEGDPAGSRDMINAWIAEQTEDRIQDLIPELDPLTRLILTNAIYFKASWSIQFDPFLTQDGDFHLLDGSTVTAPLMQMSDDFAYMETDTYQALSMSYVGDDKAMLIILPHEGEFEAIDSTFSAGDYQAALGGLESKLVYVKLPRFTADFKVSLVDALSALGMQAAFQPDADFSGMLSPENEADLYISDVIHQAFIQVDETGTEAAAATAVVMETTSARMDEPIEFHADRPFLYFIYDQSNGAILFAGRVVNPL